MPGFIYGVRRALKVVVSGIMLSVFLEILVSLGILSPFIIPLIGTIGAISLILVMPYWGTWYTIGWLFCLPILLAIGLVDVWSFLIYFILSLVVLIFRYYSDFRQIIV